MAGSGATVGAGAAVGVSGGGDMGVLVGAGVLASSVAAGGDPSSPELLGTKIAIMRTSAMRPTNPTTAHLSAFLNNKEGLPCGRMPANSAGTLDPSLSLRVTN